jgi:hypothetical protein
MKEQQKHQPNLSILPINKIKNNRNFLFNRIFHFLANRWSSNLNNNSKKKRMKSTNR